MCIALVAGAVGQIIDVGDSIQPDGAVFSIVKGETVKNTFGTIFQRQLDIIGGILVIRQRIIQDPAFIVFQCVAGS